VAEEGDLIVVGARNADPNGAGAVYLFYRSAEGVAYVMPLEPWERQVCEFGRGAIQHVKA
jgi:hypothetical protein